MASQKSPPTNRELQLPISRVKTIMKSSPNVESIGQDGLHLVVKATELFIHYFTKEAYSKNQIGPAGFLDYKQLAEIVQTNQTLEFLQEIMPRKITVREFKEMMARKSPGNNSSDSESDSQSDSASGSESEDDDDDDEEEKNGNSSDSGDDDDKENGNEESSEKSNLSSSDSEN